MNALNLTAPVDTLAMEFTRDFDAPVQALFRAHAEPDPSARNAALARIAHKLRLCYPFIAGRHCPLQQCQD